MRLVLDPASIEAAIERHVRAVFAGRRIGVLEAVAEGDRGRVAIFEVEPAEDGGVWTYISRGSWQVCPEEGPRMEFVMLAPERSARPPQLLRMTAWYHADPDPSHQLGWGHTLPIGEPWIEHSRCDVLLVCRPYPLDPRFEVLDLDGTHVHFYWLLPITESEREYRATAGLEALEQRFEDAQLRYWDPHRSPVA